LIHQQGTPTKENKMFALTVGQIIKLNVELEFWQADDSRVDRSDRWDSARVVAICDDVQELDNGTKYQNVDLVMIDGLAAGWEGNFDIEETMIED
jgi:hypothetical protein